MPIIRTGQWSTGKKSDAQKKTQLRRKFSPGIDRPDLFNEVVTANQLKVYTAVIAQDGSGDYEDIQSGLDSLPSTGGAVFVKTGTYEISTPLVLPSNCTLSGAGYTSEIKLASGADCSLLTADSINDSTIRDLYFNGDYTNQSGTSPGICLANSEHLVLENLRVASCIGSNIYFDTCNIIWLSIVFIEYSRMSGVHLEDCTRISIIHCTSEWNLEDAFLFETSAYCAITGSLMYANSGIGLHLISASHHVLTMQSGTLGNVSGSVVEESSNDDYNVYMGNIFLDVPPDFNGENDQVIGNI